MRLFLLGVLCASACAFEADVPGENNPGGEPPMDPNPPAQRCNTTGMQMCIDFEGSPMVTDAFGASLQATNVLPATRDIEKAAQWMGSSWIEVANNSKLDHANAYTIELWTKPGAIPPDEGDKQVGLFDVNFQYQMNLEANGAIECRFYDFSRTNDDNIDSKIKLAADGVWHHVACTYDRRELRVYVDGKLEGCHPSMKVVNTSDSTGAAIGANIDFGPQFRNRFIGDLDNVHLYDRALGPAEICDAWGYGSCSSMCPR